MAMNVAHKMFQCGQTVSSRLASRSRSSVTMVRPLAATPPSFAVVRNLTSSRNTACSGAAASFTQCRPRPLSTSPALAASQLRFAKSHEWVRIEAETNVGTVGLSEHATDALGEVVYVELPELDTELEAGGDCGVVESVKAASDVYAPLSGRVTAKNTAVEESPSLINKSCMEDGWLFKLELSKPDEAAELLMDEEKYKQYLDGLSQE